MAIAGVQRKERCILYTSLKKHAKSPCVQQFCCSATCRNLRRPKSVRLAGLNDGSGRCGVGGQFGVSLICGVVRAVSTVLVGKQLLYLREDPPVQVSCISFLQLGRHHRNGTCVPDSSHSTVHLSIQWPCFGIHPQLSDTLKYQVC